MEHIRGSESDFSLQFKMAINNVFKTKANVTALKGKEEKEKDFNKG